MEILAGFLIALAIGITGVGAGSITAPILILFFHQSATDAVTTALVFGTVVKLIATPIYLSRGQVISGCSSSSRSVASGGGDREPGIELLGPKSPEPAGSVIVGLTVLITAGATFGELDPEDPVETGALKWLPWIVAPIGFEVGFSSAGAAHWGRSF